MRGFIMMTGQMFNIFICLVVKNYSINSHLKLSVSAKVLAKTG